MTLREEFEKWYCATYWNFKAVETKPKIIFENEQYNHFDVDLAYNAWKAATGVVFKHLKELTGG